MSWMDQQDQSQVQVGLEKFRQSNVYDMVMRAVNNDERFGLWVCMVEDQTHEMFDVCLTRTFSETEPVLRMIYDQDASPEDAAVIVMIAQRMETVLSSLANSNE